MTDKVLRTNQSGLALPVVSAGGLLTVVITAASAPGRAFAIFSDVAAIVGVCMLAAIALAAIVGGGRGRAGAARP